MKQIEKGQNIGIRPGSFVLRGDLKTPEKTTVAEGGAVLEPPLTVLRGMWTPSQSLTAVRVVVGQGKIQGQSGVVTVLPSAEILAYA